MAELDEDAIRDRAAAVDVQACTEEAGAASKGAVVSATSPGMSGKQRRHLRGLGHHLSASLQIGQHGLTPSVAVECARELMRHELIKVRVNEGAPCEVGAAALWIHRATGAAVVQLLGRTLLAYLPHPTSPTIRLP